MRLILISLSPDLFGDGFLHPCRAENYRLTPMVDISRDSAGIGLSGTWSLVCLDAPARASQEVRLLEDES